MRDIHPDIIEYFKTKEPYSYAHLIQFERPIITSQKIDTSEKEFVYLTDSSKDEYFLNPRVAASQKYRANRVLSVPPITEYSEARATSLDLTLDASSIGAYIADLVTVSNHFGYQEIEFNIDVYDKGFVEGDKIRVEIRDVFYEAIVIKFPKDNVMRVDGTPLPSGYNNIYIELNSEELVSILQDKASPDYASFINREVIIHKAFFDADGELIGEPYYLYKGIIQDVSLDDDGGAVQVNWTLNSHWGDFAEVRGRITSDEYHRALNERGVPQPASALKPIYAYDKGFIHADTAVHLEANYTVQVEKQRVKYKKGFFGIGAKVKVKKYYENETRQTELDFQLQGKTLDVIYGVRLSEGTPIFADTDTNNSSDVYVAYSFCEGEVAAVYDLIINDKSLICNNEADFDSRSTQTSENTIDVVCYGRSDRGDVLEGITSTTNNSISFFNNTDSLSYFNNQSLSYLTNYQGFTQPLNTSSGSVGILHENSINISEPINMTFSFYSGKSNQSAAPNLVSIAQNQGFKVQNDYWKGSDKMEYWGPNHRLLDTAYAVVNYKISEEDTTIPQIKSVIKGKFINCYNYDNSYQHYSKASTENAANFALGDLVDIYDEDNVVINTAVKIVKVFNIRNNQGLLEPRFELSETPNLNYVNGIPTKTKFSIRKGGATWTMVTFNYIEEEGSVSESLEDQVVSVAPDTNNNVAINVGQNSIIEKIFTSNTIGAGAGKSRDSGFRLVSNV